MRACLEDGVSYKGCFAAGLGFKRVQGKVGLGRSKGVQFVVGFPGEQRDELLQRDGLFRGVDDGFDL